MKVPTEIKKCVVLVGVKMADESFSVAGTAFFVSDTKGNVTYTCAVTARHVVEEIKAKESEYVYLGINLKNGEAQWYKTKLDFWIYARDINVDIAVFPLQLKPEFDHQVYPLTSALTPAKTKEMEVDVGDEVFIAGLFYHYGAQRNIPIIRLGNIAAMPEEEIQSKDMYIDAYLIEARSIGGLIGSPVFVNYGLMRILGGQRHYPNKRVNLLGIVHSHHTNFGSESNGDIEEKSEVYLGKVNTGIVTVTPIEKLVRLLLEIELEQIT